MKCSEFYAVLQNAREKCTEIFLQVRRTVNFNSSRALPISKGIITTIVNGEILQFGGGEGCCYEKKDQVNLTSASIWKTRLTFNTLALYCWKGMPHFGEMRRVISQRRTYLFCSSEWSLSVASTSPRGAGVETINQLGLAPTGASVQWSWQRQKYKRRWLHLQRLMMKPLNGFKRMSANINEYVSVSRGFISKPVLLGWST